MKELKLRKSTINNFPRVTQPVKWQNQNFFFLRELSVFLKPWLESITGFPCCRYRGCRKRAEGKVRGQSESHRVVYDMTLGVSWPWGDWDMGTPVGIFAGPQEVRAQFACAELCIQSRHPPLFYLPFKHTAPHSGLVTSKSGCKFTCSFQRGPQPLGVNQGQSAYELLLTRVSMRPHTCQGPSHRTSI